MNESLILIRPVFNRPEMLALSIEAEEAARARAPHVIEHTIFALEYKAARACLRLIEAYPYPKTVLRRTEPSRFAPAANILSAFSHACERPGPSVCLNIEATVFCIRMHCAIYRLFERWCTQGPFRCSRPGGFPVAPPAWCNRAISQMGPA